MRWSKVRKLVEDSFAPSVRGRVTMYGTRYGACTCGRGTIRVDGRELANMDVRALWRDGESRWPLDEHSHAVVADAERVPGTLAEPGELTRYQLFEACWEYLHSSIAHSLASDNPLVKSLAVLDARVGKRRLRMLAEEHLHPLTRALLEFRMSAGAAAAAAS